MAKSVAERTNIAGNFRTLIAERAAVWTGLGGDIRQVPTNPSTGVGASWQNLFYRPYLLQTLLDGSNAPEIRPWRANLVTRYDFTTGRLKGVMVGGSYRWQDRVVIGYRSIVKNLQGVDTETYDINDPYYGPTDDAIDLWVAYRRKIGKRIGWRIQLNLQNAFERPQLIPINVQPNGTPAAYRIREGMTWTLTNTFSF